MKESIRPYNQKHFILGAGKGTGLKTAELLKDENLHTISQNMAPELLALDTHFFQQDASKDDLSEVSLPAELLGLFFCPGSKRHPLQRIGSADDSAQLAAFLVSEQSSWITGQIIGVDGGLGYIKL